MNGKGTKAVLKRKVKHCGLDLVGPPPRAITFSSGIEYLLGDGELPKTEAKRKAFIKDLEREIEDAVWDALRDRFGRRVSVAVECGSLTW